MDNQKNFEDMIKIYLEKKKSKDNWYYLFILLDDTSPLTYEEIAKKSNLAKKTITDNFNKMFIVTGLCEKVPGLPMRVKLTDKGKRLKEYLISHDEVPKMKIEKIPALKEVPLGVDTQKKNQVNLNNLIVESLNTSPKNVQQLAEELKMSTFIIRERLNTDLIRKGLVKSFFKDTVQFYRVANIEKKKFLGEDSDRKTSQEIDLVSRLGEYQKAGELVDEELSKMMSLIVPYIFDDNTELEVSTILSRINTIHYYFSRKTSQNPPSEKLAAAVVDVCLGRPKVFDVKTRKHDPNPLFTKIIVKDFELLHLLKIYPDQERFFDIYVRSNRKDIFSNKLLRNTINEFREIEKKLKKALEDSEIELGTVLAISYGCLHPEWLFGLNYKTELEKINDQLKKVGYRIAESDAKPDAKLFYLEEVGY